MSKLLHCDIETCKLSFLVLKFVVVMESGNTHVAMNLKLMATNKSYKCGTSSGKCHDDLPN